MGRQYERVKLIENLLALISSVIHKFLTGNLREQA
jgi:hypothetical protein